MHGDSKQAAGYLPSHPLPQTHSRHALTWLWMERDTALMEPGGDDGDRRLMPTNTCSVAVFLLTSAGPSHLSALHTAGHWPCIQGQVIMSPGMLSLPTGYLQQLLTDGNHSAQTAIIVLCSCPHHPATSLAHHHCQLTNQPTN